MEKPDRADPARPGWLEIAVGLLGLAVVGMAGGALVVRLPIGPVAIGLILAALSGIGCMAGFFAAFLWRVRSWPAFGVRRTTLRWLLVGAAAGVAAFIVKGFAVLAYIALTGDGSTPQDVYAKGASGGLWTVLAATFFIAVVTPIGEEFLFRGVVTSALLRYGPLAGVVGGALIFAIFHGFNVISRWPWWPALRRARCSAAAARYGRRWSCMSSSTCRPSPSWCSPPRSRRRRAT